MSGRQRRADVAAERAYLKAKFDAERAADENMFDRLDLTRDPAVRITSDPDKGTRYHKVR
jgi:hypothetical protein